MIRLIFRDEDATAAAHSAGPVDVRHKTFDVSLPEVEAWLNEPAEKQMAYTRRTLVGMELLPATLEKQP